MDKFEFISQIVSTLLLAASAIYGIAVSFKKKSILFAQIIASGVACLALGNIFTLMLRITAPEEIKIRPQLFGQLPEDFLLLCCMVFAPVL